MSMCKSPPDQSLDQPNYGSSFMNSFVSNNGGGQFSNIPLAPKRSKIN